VSVRPLSSTPPALLTGLLLILCLLGAGCYRDTPASPHMAVQMLTDLLSDPDASIRRTAAEALGKIGVAGAESVLVGALQDSSPAVRRAAARSLGQLSSVGAETGRQLVSLLADPDRAVTQAAAQALGSVGDMSLLAPSIVGFLTGPDARVRQSAAHAVLLGDTPDGAVAAALMKATQDADPAVRQWAVAAIGESGASGMASTLLDRLLHDPSENVRAEAAYRLRFSGEGRVARALEAVEGRSGSADVARWVKDTLAVLRTTSGSY
jgi:HEAT repeat protein